MSGQITWHLRVLHDTVFSRPPDGTPGIRDIDHPCGTFDHGEPNGRCMTDGHYICIECRHLDPKSEYGLERLEQYRQWELQKSLGA